MFRKLSMTFAVAVFVAVAAAFADASEFHFALTKSAPAADSKVSPPSELRLWFSQVPQSGSLSVRLVDAGGDLVETGEPVSDEADAKVVGIAIPHAIGSGTYTVAWRGIGDDGHVVRGEFGFEVTAQR